MKSPLDGIKGILGGHSEESISETEDVATETIQK